MKNILKEEINQIQYLFGYKRGIVISEQTDPNALQKIEMIKKMREKESDPDMQKLYDSLIEYYTKLSNGETATSPNEKYTNFIDSNFTAQTPELPNAETADLGNAPKEVIDYFNSTKTEHPNAVLSYGFTSGNNRDLAETKAREDARKKLKINGEPKIVGSRMVYPRKDGGYDVYGIFEP